MMNYEKSVTDLVGDIPKLNILVGMPGYKQELVVQVCSQLNISNYLDFFTTLPELYDKWYKNNHHWTTRFVWKTMLPKIMEFLGVSSYEDDFEEIECFSDGNDITYHNWKYDTPFKFICIDDRYELTGDFNILRDITTKQVNDSAFTDYHRLFVGAHRNCIVKNERPSTNIRLFINADSMTIPIIPLIAPFVQEIFVYDSHKSSIDRQIILDFKPTHYMLCNTIMNVFNGNIMRKLAI